MLFQIVAKPSLFLLVPSQQLADINNVVPLCRHPSISARIAGDGVQPDSMLVHYILDKSCANPATLLNFLSIDPLTPGETSAGSIWS
jgi:hypothetical protein